LALIAFAFCLGDIFFPQGTGLFVKADGAYLLSLNTHQSITHTPLAENMFGIIAAILSVVLIGLSWFTMNMGKDR